MNRIVRPLTCAALGTAVLATSLGATVSAFAAVPTAWTELAHDSYSRQLTGNWGGADLGGSYKLNTASKSIGVDGAAAFETLTLGQGLTAPIAISAGDVNASDDLTLTAPAGTAFDISHSISVRTQGDGSAYVGRVRVNDAGKATIMVSRQNQTTSTSLGGITLPSTVTLGQTIHLELQATGSTQVRLKMRAWVDSDATPDWQVDYTDTDAKLIGSAGSVVLNDYAFKAGSAITVKHDNLSVASGDGVAPADTPSASPTDTPTPDAPSIPPTTVPRDTRGSVPVGTASYAVPAGALFVDPVNGKDTNAGTLTAPFKTVVYAVTKVKTGGTLVLRAGTYHESVSVESNKTVTIQNYPGEAVWFDGSATVTKWAKSGTSWVSTGWNSKYSSLMGSDAAFKSRFIGDNTMAANPDLLFVNGTQQKQVASASAVTAGTFYYNESASTLVMGSDPTGQEVRASDLTKAISLAGPNSIVEGIGVRRYANGYEVGGALKVGNTGGTIRNVDVEDVATIGIGVSGAGKTIDHVTVQHAGMVGIAGNLNDNSVVSNTIVSNNNTESFKDEPVSGGMKFTSARTLTVNNVEANNNHGTGIWLDVSSYNLTVVNNTANNDTKHGIEVEISDTGIIANNQAINDGDDGIILFDAGNFKVFNNDFGGSQLFGIKLAQDDRRQADLTANAEGRDPRSRTAVDPTVPWITQNIQMSNNAFGNGGGFQLYALDGRTNRAVDTWNLTVNGNLFNKRVVKTDPTMVAWGKGDNVTLERYEAPAALSTAKGSSWTNAQIATSKAITDMESDKAAAAATSLPLPADVATAIGVPAGTQMMGVH